MTKANYTLTGITHDTFVEIHDKFMPHTAIVSHRWSVSTQTFDIELSDKVIFDITNGDITLFLAGESITLGHDDYIYLKCM